MLFLSDSRDHISGNFEYIYNYLKENNPDYELKTHLKKSLKTKRKFKEKILLLKDIASSKYILVDEFQDTSTAQCRMVMLMSNERRNLCAIGDDYQLIYSFRGAEIENILNFQKKTGE